jgi:hypothetical protein
LASKVYAIDNFGMTRRFANRAEDNFGRFPKCAELFRNRQQVNRTGTNRVVHRSGFGERVATPRPVRCAVALLGGTAPYLMEWLQSHHRANWWLLDVSASAMVSLVRYWVMPEMKGRALT